LAPKILLSIESTKSCLLFFVLLQKKKRKCEQCCE